MSKERAVHYISIVTGKMPADLKASHIKEINKISKTMRVLKSGGIWDKKQKNKGLLVAVGIAILIMTFPAYEQGFVPFYSNLKLKICRTITYRCR